MSEFLSIIFGVDGFATGVLNGYWYITGFFILGFFLFALLSGKSSSENIVWFLFFFFLISMSYGIFQFPIGLVSLILIFLTLFAGFYVYYIFYKPD